MIRLNSMVVPVASLVTIVVFALACGDGGTEPLPDPPRPTMVTVTPTSAELAALGATAQFAAEVHDQYGQVMTGVSVAWASSDASVAAVDASGLVTAAGNGAATITAAAGGVSGGAEVTVAQVVSAVSVAPAAAALAALGDTVRLLAEAADANGNPVAAAGFAWSSSDAGVAAVDASGLVTAADNGAATITAAAGGVSGGAEVTVAQVVSAVSVAPAAAALAALGDTVRLLAEAADANGNPVAAAGFAWSSSDAGVAAVDASGLVTAAGNGAATITAAAGGVSGGAEVTVAQVVSAVSVAPAAAALAALGDTVRLLAEAADANGNPVAAAGFAWSSSDAGVAAVDASGLVTAADNGAATITAAAGGVSGGAEVTVAQVVSAVSVAPAAAALAALGDTVRLLAEAADANGNPVAAAGFAWSSSDAGVAAVDASGLVTAAGNGAATITAAAGGVSGGAEVTVAQVVSAVSVAPAAAALAALGDTVRLLAEAADANGNPVAAAGFAWSSSDAGVAAVDASGLVTAAGNGAATITAAAGGVSGGAEVTVAQVVSAVSVAPAAAALAALGDTVRLLAEAADANGNPVAAAGFAWSSSDAGVAAVDASGLVTAADNGAATITAAAGGVSGGAEVTVAQVVSAVSVAPAAAALAALGDTVRLLAEAADANGNPVATAGFAWSSSDAGVAAVDASGLVTGADNGAATITAAVGGVSGGAEVTVAQVVSAVMVSPGSASVVERDTLRMVATAADANGHVVAAAAFAWATSDTLLARVDDSGLVTGVAEGEVAVMATAFGVTGRARFMVVATVPTTVAVTPDTVRFTAVGQTVELAVAVRDQIGREIPGPDVSWTSGDTLVAAVDSAGLATAAGVGATTITATAGSVSGTALIMVPNRAPNRAPVPRGTIPPMTIPAGETPTMEASSYFTDPDGDTLRYTASVADSGVVRASVAGGTVTIRGVARGTTDVTVAATDSDGASATQTFETTVPNRAPKPAGSIPAQTLNPGGTVAINASRHFTDPDGDALTYTATSSNTGVATVSVSGSTVTITGVATGGATVAITARDPGELTATQSVSVTVKQGNQAPQPAGSIPAQTLNPGGTVAINASRHFTDPDGDALTYTATSSNTGAATVSVSGSTVTITSVATGVATVTITARDPGELTATQSVSVTVKRGNHAPWPVRSIPAQTSNPGGTVAIKASQYFTDPNGDALTYTATSSNTDVATVSVSGSTVTITCIATGGATVTITARDPGELTATQSVSVTVKQGNHAPKPVGSIPAQTLNPGGTVAINASRHFTDPDGDALTYTATSSNTGAATVSVSGSTVTITGVATGVATVTITARDPLTATQSVSVTVTAAPTRLTNNNGGNNFGPAWSPDGTKIAFTSSRDGNFEIYVMGTDGSNPTRLTDNNADDGSPAWSPDGTKIAFDTDRNDGSNEIYVMAADGSSPTRLTNGGYNFGPAWSPDGTKIAFVSYRDDDYEIYVMDADGSSPTRLTNSGGYDGQPAWSPDGTKIAFYTDRDGGRLYVMDTDGSNPTRLTNNRGGSPAWSPDGTRIAFASSIAGDFEIYVMNVDGSSVTRLTPNADASTPSWSPDGTQIAFESTRDGPYEIYVMSVPASANAAASRAGPERMDSEPEMTLRASLMPPGPTRD